MTTLHEARIGINPLKKVGLGEPFSPSFLFSDPEAVKRGLGVAETPFELPLLGKGVMVLRHRPVHIGEFANGIGPRIFQHEVPAGSVQGSFEFNGSEFEVKDWPVRVALRLEAVPRGHSRNFAVTYEMNGIQYVGLPHYFAPHYKDTVKIGFSQWHRLDENGEPIVKNVDGVAIELPGDKEIVEKGHFVITPLA